MIYCTVEALGMYSELEVKVRIKSEYLDDLIFS